MNLHREEHAWNPVDRDKALKEPAPLVLDRAAKGDLRALTTLYEELAPPAFRLAFRITGSVQDAQDVVQDLFLGLPEALASFRRDAKFLTWFRQCAARQALKALRARRRRKEVALRPEWIIGSDGPGLEAIELERALHRLPETLRTVVVLRDIEGFTHEEVAEILGISPTASRMRLVRAREQLREWVGWR